MVILYCGFCLLSTLFIAYSMFIVLMHSIFSDDGFDFQIIFFVLLSVLLVIGLWSLLFIKVKIFVKILIFLLLLSVQWGYLNISTFLPSVKKVFDMDFCMDSGTCAEGLKTGIDGNVVEINKENCLKYNKAWDEERKWCQVR